MYKKDFILINLQWLICHIPNQSKSYIFDIEDKTQQNQNTPDQSKLRAMTIQRYSTSPRPSKLV